jgi:hypothetical protein
MAGLRRISEKFFRRNEGLLACFVELDADGQSAWLAYTPSRP